MKGSRLEHPGAARVGRLPGHNHNDSSSRAPGAGEILVQVQSVCGCVPVAACVVMGRARAQGTEDQTHKEARQDKTAGLGWPESESCYLASYPASDRERPEVGGYTAVSLFSSLTCFLVGLVGRLHELHQEPHRSRRGRALAGQGIFLPCPGELGATRGAAQRRLHGLDQQNLRDAITDSVSCCALAAGQVPGAAHSVRQTSTLCITGSGRGFRASPPGTQGDHATGPAPRRARRRGRAHPAEALL